MNRPPHQPQQERFCARHHCSPLTSLDNPVAWQSLPFSTGRNNILQRGKYSLISRFTQAWTGLHRRLIMKYWWRIFDNVLGVPGTQLRMNEHLPLGGSALFLPRVGGAQKSQDFVSLCSSYPLHSPSSKQETYAPSPAPSPEQRWREGEKRKKGKALLLPWLALL